MQRDTSTAKAERALRSREDRRIASDIGVTIARCGDKASGVWRIPGVPGFRSTARGP
jgi:hypothetical protein